jgi:hypothetical protein
MCPQNEAMFEDSKRKGQLLGMVDRRELSRFPKIQSWARRIAANIAKLPTLLTNHPTCHKATPVRINSPAQNYKSPETCIYCGRINVELTDEHIIPLALGGTLVLEKASCKECAKIASNVEQQCLRRMFAPLRSRAGFPSRRPKEQKRREPLFVVTLDDRVEQKSITLLEHPAGLCLMRVEPPRLLVGLPPLRNEFKGDLWWTYLTDDTLQKIRQYGGKGLRIASFNPAFFARMIAKIAHEREAIG